MPSAIVTTTYRYKRPPRKKKPIVLTGSAIVRSGRNHEDVSKPATPAPANDDRKSAIVTVTSTRVAKADRPLPVRDGSDLTPSATVSPSSGSVADAPRSAIVTARRPGARSSAYVPDMTAEEHRRRGAAADALFREMVHRVTGKP